MLAILLILLGFKYKIIDLLRVNVLIPLLILRPYIFSFDPRIIIFCLCILILLNKSLPSKILINQEEKSSLLELNIVLIWTLILYYFIGFRHHFVNLNPVVPHLLLLKWYVFWILLKRQNRYGLIIRFFVIISMLLFDGRTEVFMLLTFLLFKNINQERFVYKVYPYFICLTFIIAIFSIYTASRNIAFQREVELSQVLNILDNELVQELLNNYVLERLTEAEISTKLIWEQDPSYLATYRNLPNLLIPRFIWKDKGYFLPGVYYNSLINNTKESIESKNLEVGFLGIWWHNFGFLSLIFFTFILFLVLLLKDYNAIFLIFTLPKLFGDYNQIPLILESLIIYLLIRQIYVSYSRNR